MGVKLEPVPLSVTLPLFVLTAAVPGTLSVAPLIASQVPPVSVLPENCGGVALIASVPEWLDHTRVAEAEMFWIVEVPVPPALVNVPSLVKVP